MNKTGSYVSVDFDISNLKIYYDEKSYSNAYRELKTYMKKYDFEHIKDTNYVNHDINILDTYKILDNFARDNKWFALCINKVNVMPINKTWDLTFDIIKDNTDVEFKKQKELEYEKKYSKKENNSKVQSRPSMISRIRKKKEIIDENKKENNPKTKEKNIQER